MCITICALLYVHYYTILKAIKEEKEAEDAKKRERQRAMTRGKKGDEKSPDDVAVTQEPSMQDKAAEDAAAAGYWYNISTEAKILFGAWQA